MMIREIKRKPRKRTRKNKEKIKKVGGWLNKNDFVYAGQDTVNTVLVTFKNMVPSLIRNASSQIDRVAQSGI